MTKSTCSTDWLHISLDSNQNCTENIDVSTYIQIHTSSDDKS